MNTFYLMEILKAKEERAERQQAMLKNGGVLICFTLNIPGPVKISELYRDLFDAGKELIENAVRKKGMSPKEEYTETTAAGYVYYALFDGGTDMFFMKELMTGIENETDAGRLFDIDVLCGNEGGYPEKISRKAMGQPERSCIICGSPAFVCLRAARHTVPQVLKKAVDIITDSKAVRERIFCAEQPGCNNKDLSCFAEETAVRALKALLFEVITTPKPGLVDADNNGSHKDMNITAFFDSAAAITPYFKECVIKGAMLCNADHEAVLPELRPLGIKAEEKMFSVTGGVNTHKGAVFTFGVVCAAIGRMFASGSTGVSDPATVLMAAGKICSSMENGSEGIRREVRNGYPTVRSALEELKAYRSRRGSDESFNTEGIRLLCFIMSQTLDSNIVRRAGLERAENSRKEASALKPFHTPSEELLSRMAELDAQYIAENISPGGAADLLALSYFFLDTKSD